MKKVVNFYVKHYEEFMEFKKQKKVSEEKIIHMIVQDLGVYYGAVHIPENDKKIAVKIKGDKEDFEELARASTTSLFRDMCPHVIYNYMWEHKDDEVPEEKVGGKIVSLYFPAEKWEKFKSMKGDKKTSEYIMEILFNEKGC